MHNYGWYRACRRYAEAQVQFNDALAQPRYRDVARDAGFAQACARRAGQLTEAHVRGALRSTPGNTAIALNLAEVLFQRGDYARHTSGA